ncbi:MAG: response regulator transcription factor [Betaproteobacteria bacterium]|nr:response regulator transcription factor [Betaproteobacteria bacterium]
MHRPLIPVETAPVDRLAETPAARLLVVEDDEQVGSGLVTGLSQEGFSVLRVANGEDALGACSSSDYDLVLLDIGLPGIDGFEVLRRLRAARRMMPVMMLTARDAIDDRVRGLDLGADDYMTKPFALPELAARARALIRRVATRAAPRLVHGPLTLDLAGRRAFIQGAAIELAAREWEVLILLLERVEKVVSKDAFINALIGFEHEITPNAIEVYISRLRSKLDAAGIRIRTVRGFGYMLEEYRERNAAL